MSGFRSERRSRASSPSLSGLSARQPQPFDGEPATFKEWAFGVEIALKASPSRSPDDEVNFAANLLSGNARLWLMSALEAGDTFKDWPSLRDALADVYGPRFDSEQARLSLFSLKQFRDVDHFTSEFTRLSLQIPELHEHTRALLFVNGLRPEIRQAVLREHPDTSSRAIQAALTAEQARFLGAPRPRASMSASSNRGHRRGVPGRARAVDAGTTVFRFQENRPHGEGLP